VGGMKNLARFLFENSPYSEFWSAWLVGFCVVGGDGRIYLSAAGQEYLEGT
jgi:hypothetical protein